MKKFSKNYLYYHLLSDIFSVLVFVFLFIDAILIENEAEEVVGINYALLPFFIVGALVVYGVMILYRVLYLRTASYTLLDGEIRVTRGVLFRKNSVLEYKKMHAINKKQNIVQRLFGLAVLTVDSGSTNTSTAAEILIYETTAETDRLLALLKARRDGAEAAEAPAAEAATAEETAVTEQVIAPKGGDLVFTSGKKLIYALLTIATTAFSILSIAAIALLCYVCLLPVLYDLLEGGAFFFIVPALAIALIATVLFSVFAFIVSILQSFVAYYNFRIVKNARDLEISYGLLTRHTNTFGYDRIAGVLVSQGLIQRIGSRKKGTWQVTTNA